MSGPKLEKRTLVLTCQRCGTSRRIGDGDQVDHAETICRVCVAAAAMRFNYEEVPT